MNLTPGPEAIWTYQTKGLDVHPKNDNVVFFGIGVGPYYYPQDANFRLMRTTDEGATWTDLTGELVNPASTSTDQNVFSRWGASAIAIDPDSDPNDIANMTVYVGMEGVPDVDGFERVFKSINGGDDWVDISTGLPGFQVNALKCQPGSGGVLYAATDVGVFVYLPQLGEWKCFSADLPVCLVTDLEVNLCTGKLYACLLYTSRCV